MKIHKKPIFHLLDGNLLYGHVFQSPAGTRFECVSIDKDPADTINNNPNAEYKYTAATPSGVELWLKLNPQYRDRISTTLSITNR